MWILEERTLKAFWRKHPNAKGPLLAWVHEVEVGRWEGPAEIRARYRTADFVKDKAVFNVAGNTYRLVVRFAYASKKQKPQLNGMAFVLFVGTHAQYDSVDVTEL